MYMYVSMYVRIVYFVVVKGDRVAQLILEKIATPTVEEVNVSQ